MTATLLVIDRATGQTERIDETDPRFMESVKASVLPMGITLNRALDLLQQGETLATAGYLRRIARAGE